MRIQTTLGFTALIVAMAIAPVSSVLAADAPELTVRNYVRAETDLQMRKGATFTITHVEGRVPR